jgi:hypothetical protein
MPPQLMSTTERISKLGVATIEAKKTRKSSYPLTGWQLHCTFSALRSEVHICSVHSESQSMLTRNMTVPCMCTMLFNTSCSDSRGTSI